ncbi:MAG: hypothetical protein LQ338_000486 [Usnochroma carphineum]|nr:MAG: hypothetical protein LQ338_000486 [Usnochroma carphineum]
MSPVNPCVISQLRQLIYYHLDNQLLRNALFFAGRLQAYDPRSPDSAYLLALCYFRLGQLKSAYDSSRHWIQRGANSHLGCSFIFAQACLGLGKYIEGTAALDKSKGVWLHKNNWNKHSDSRRQHTPDAAAIHCLQGKLWQAHRDSTKAIESYAEALKLNPFMWDAFTGLCDLGVNVRIPNIFQVTPEMKRALQIPNSDESTLETVDESPASGALSQSQSANNINISQPPANNDPFSISKNRINGEVRPNLGIFDKLSIGKATVTPINGGDLELSAFDTPTGPGGSFNNDDFLGREIKSHQTTATNGIEVPLAPTRKARPAPALGADVTADGPPRMRTNAVRSHSRSKAESDEASNGRPPSVTHGIAERKRTISGQAASAAANTAASNPPSSVNDPTAPQRRSRRLFNQFRPQGEKSAVPGTTATREERESKRKAKATGTKGRSTNPVNVGRVVSGNRMHSEAMDVDGKEQRRPATTQTSGPEHKLKSTSSEGSREQEALKWLLDLLTKLAYAYFAQSHYRCQEAIAIYNNVTFSQRDTPWVMSQIGRAYFQQALWSDAEKIYARLKGMAPSRIEDMEVYSTCLWHLRKEVDLAFLAHEVIDIDRNSPQAWCVVGNSFSVQRDHDQAIKCFKRATQLDPKFAYAYTLQGHECIENEEYDKALSAFRNAIAVDTRHFNAWYGLGRVYEKQGKYDFAEQHYQTAAGINPSSAVLLTCIGAVLEKLKNPRAALVQYTKACELSPPVAIARFKRARVLANLEQPQAALEELKLLKTIAPDEANVFYLLGKVHLMLKQKSEAVRNWTIAGNLDPKVSDGDGDWHHLFLLLTTGKAQPLIKEQMERMEDMEDDEYDTLHIS